ncbi:MAG TPA: PHB depolymerase family esterase [Telluria sp.]|nr:PHB depolymerase family esterase [Telluria sp.]
MNKAKIRRGAVTRPEGKREFLLAQPSAPASGKRALVLILHGHGASAGVMFGSQRKWNSAFQQWLVIADREDILVIAPEGWVGSDGKQGWNDCRADAPSNPTTDDVGFLAAVIDLALAEYGADPERVYISGMSNGGAMTYRAAIALGPRLAAVAALSALMPVHSQCEAPRHPLPVLLCHGTADKIAPYAGGGIGHWTLRGRGTGYSAEESGAIWRRLAGLEGAPEVYPYPKRDPKDHTSAVRRTWGADPAGLQVVCIEVEGAGHTEPSIAFPLAWAWTAVVGRQNRDVEIAEEIWSFFRDKRRRA